MLFDTSAEGNLFTNVCASRAGKLELSSILLDGNNLGTSGSRTDVHHDNLVLGKLVNLGLLALGSLDTKKPAEEVKVDLNLAVNLRKASLKTKDETNETIGSAEGGIDASTNTNKTTGNGVLEVVGLGVERNDSAEDGRALEVTLVVTGNDTWTNLDLVTELEKAVKNRTTGNTTLKFLDLSTGLINVEGTDNDHVWIHGEISGRNGNGVDNSVVDSVDVELELGGDGDDRRLAGNGSADELEDRLVVSLGGLLPHKIDLVLEDDNLVQLHDLDGGQMLRGLGLGASFVSGNKQKGGVHDGGTRQHGAHQNIVARAIDETACC